MNIQDNVLKNYLKHVYFITGTPCGGKTTVSRALSERHDFALYDADEHFSHHRQISDPTFQPAMNQTFRDADEFFGRSVAEYQSWLLHSRREQLDFMLLDLICLSQDRIVICDCDITVEEADRLTDPSRTAFFTKDPSDLVEEYCNRPDHLDFSRFINSSTDVAHARAICRETLKELNMKRIADIRNSPYFRLDRSEGLSVEETVRLTERHFGW